MPFIHEALTGVLAVLMAGYGRPFGTLSPVQLLVSHSWRRSHCGLGVVVKETTTLVFCPLCFHKTNKKKNKNYIKKKKDQLQGQSGVLPPSHGSIRKGPQNWDTFITFVILHNLFRFYFPFSLEVSTKPFPCGVIKINKALLTSFFFF